MFTWPIMVIKCPATLQWRHNGHNGISDHQPHDCLFNRLFRRRSKKTSKLRVTGLCVGNSPVTGEFSAQMASNNAENASIWWRHHDTHRHKLSAQSPSVVLYITGSPPDLRIPFHKLFFSADWKFLTVITLLIRGLPSAEYKLLKRVFNRNLYESKTKYPSTMVCQPGGSLGLLSVVVKSLHLLGRSVTLPYSVDLVYGLGSR